MGYSKLLTKYIERSDLSLRKIAELCNSKGFSIDHSYISKLRTGKKPPPSEELSRILAEVVGGDPEALVIEGYKEKAPEEIKKLLSTKSIEYGIDIQTPLIIAEKPNDGISHQRTGRISRQKYSIVLELADILENDNILITAGGEPLDRNRRINLLNAIDKPMNKQILEPKCTLPLIGNIRAGIPLLSEQNIVGHIEIPSDLVGKADFALNVQGDSMIGAGINTGDVAVCKENHEAVIGQIVVALVNSDETTLKYYFKENGQALLRAANPDYKDIELKPGDIIQGHVVKILKDPPPVNTYREYIYFKEGHLQEWNKVVEKAVASGIKPSLIGEFLESQMEIAKRLAGK